MAFPTVEVVESYSAAHEDYDAVILVGDYAQAVPDEFADFVGRAQQFDQRVGKQPLLVAADVFGGRLITAPTGPLMRDYDDVRNISDAAALVRELRSKRACASLYWWCLAPRMTDVTGRLKRSPIGACVRRFTSRLKRVKP